MAKFHLPSLEEEQLNKWEANNVFKRILARKKNPRGDFVFFEGPPTANGKPGIHHLLARAYKDVILRFRTMQGYRIDRKAGWDTHGLPVELEVEKQLGFTKKQDIEQYGIAAFNAKCRESVWKYLDLWQKSTKRIAFWVDLDHPYVTYENDYVESLWWILKEVDKKGLLYQGYRVTPHCPRCVTSLSSHELAQGYKDTEDPSVYVKFQVSEKEKKYFLVWTTTPWTLPANVALAVGPAVRYVEAKMKETGDTFVLARERLAVLDGEYEVMKEMSGADLVGMRYAPLYQTMTYDDKRAANAYGVYAADFVSTGDGTGIVHIAPAFGEDDAALGSEKNLPTLLTVDNTGMMTADVPGKGKFFKKADADISADLASRGLLYKSETYMHSYPFCWRCGTPLLYYAKSSWYIAMSKLRESLRKHNQAINWVPAHIKEGRFGEWLKDVKDWALSRERYWGTPLPVWQCGSCKEKTVIGSLAELDALSLPKNHYYFQRHGESETNVTSVISSWPEKKEFHLTEKGRAQVAASAKKLKKKGVEMIFASDLVRTKETAEIIAKETGVPIVFDERLRELNVGAFNGRPDREYHASFSNRLERFAKAPEGGESLHECRKRMVDFIKELEQKHRGKKIVIVSHGDPLWMLQTGFEGLSDEASLDWPHYNGVGEFREMELNNLPHDESGRVDVHRPFIDEVRLACPKCAGEMRRVADVVDVWFDSGAMPFAQWHYPFENKSRIDAGTNFPADYISEAIDQTRGWFYTLLAVATLLGKETPPYKNVICLGHVLDGKGQKMSKSKGNVVDPFVAIDKFGADAIRYYFFTVNQPGDPKRFDEKAVEDVVKKTFLILWNVLSFYKMYAGEKPKVVKSPKHPVHALDRWILSRLAFLEKSVTDGLTQYNVIDAGRELAAFVDDLSTWYVRRSRDRFKGVEKKEALATLGFSLHTLAKLMAPFTPFLTDALYAETGGKEDSVHLEEWPDDLAQYDDPDLRAAMEAVRGAASVGLEKRAAAGIPVRQALAKASVVAPTNRQDWMIELLKEELNVLDVDWAAGEKLDVTLDTQLTPELKRMGAAREVVRNVNELRKEAGLTIQDRITLRYDGGEFWKQVFAEHGEALKGDVLAARVEFGRGETMKEKELSFDGEALWVGILKV